MLRRTAAIAAAALVLLTACARPADVGGPGIASDAPLTPVEIHDAWTSCKEVIADPLRAPGDLPLGLERLPADFAPAEVVVCSIGSQQRADGAEEQVWAERRGDKVEALTAALRLPDVPRTDQPCTADLPGVPWFAVIDKAGRWLRPGVAADACGKLRLEVRRAVDELQLRTVATTVLGETKSAAAAKAGCEQRWSDMVGAVMASPPTPPAGRPFDPPQGQMRLCVYTVAPEEQGSGKPAGNFERGGPLPAATWASLRAAMLPAGPVVPCTAHASRFALFRPVDERGGEVYLELDGCHRMLFSAPSGETLRQGTQALADQVAKAL
ncbi:hypothetical protein [Dactylosporangium darangshiense]|uniref:Secreted protein n=1 Tax=Dactylosporangium darangshiense TaxID=579108 RepID=A0ABP8D7C5_9ACTN